MKLFTTDRGIAREGADGALEILDLPEPDLGALLNVDPTLDRARNAEIRERVARDAVTLLAPVLQPRKIVCMGINYASHVEEVRPMVERIGAQVPTDPVFFLAPGSSVIGPEQPIVLPEIAPGNVDYEIELAAVIGRGGVRISAYGRQSAPNTATMGHRESSQAQQRAFKLPIRQNEASQTQEVRLIFLSAESTSLVTRRKCRGEQAGWETPT